MAINGLNALVGNINREGGIRRYADTPFPAQAETAWLSERHISELARAADAGRRPPGPLALRLQSSVYGSTYRSDPSFL